MSNNPNTGSIRLLATVAVAILAVVGVSACSGQGGAPAADTASDVRDEDSSDAASAPSWYLAEFPQHPDLQLKSVSESDTGVYLVAYQSRSGEGEALADWFQTHYSQNGWTIDQKFGDSRFTAEKGDAYQAAVNINDTKYTTIVTITVSDRG